MKNYFLAWAILILLVSFTEASAISDEKDVIATLERFDGLIKVLPNGSIKRTKAKEHQKLYGGDMVLSYRGAHAIVILADGSKVVLDESASMRFSLNEVEQKSGAVYYEIHHRNAKHALKVKTEFAIIGIKGTTFIVNANVQNESVALQEGNIEVKSPEAAYRLYRDKVEADFEAYQNKQNQGFEAYKNRQNEKIESYVQAFEMQAGKVVNFKGSVADESDFDANITAKFERFKRIQASFN